MQRILLAAGVRAPSIYFALSFNLDQDSKFSFKICISLKSNPPEQENLSLESLGSEGLIHGAVITLHLAHLIHCTGSFKLGSHLGSVHPTTNIPPSALPDDIKGWVHKAFSSKAGGSDATQAPRLPLHPVHKGWKRHTSNLQSHQSPSGCGFDHIWGRRGFQSAHLPRHKAGKHFPSSPSAINTLKYSSFPRNIKPSILFLCKLQVRTTPTPH